MSVVKLDFLGQMRKTSGKRHEVKGATPAATELHIFEHYRT